MRVSCGLIGGHWWGKRDVSTERKTPARGEGETAAAIARS
jgi:hypothetical protein